MTPKPHILPLIILLAALSCSRVDIPSDQGERVAIGFTVEAGAPATRADGTMDLEALKEKGFGVFACYTGIHRYSESSVTADFMHNQEVVWDTTNQLWSYAPLKYWPNDSHFVSFFAYAPYSDGDAFSPDTHPEGYCIPNFCSPQELSDPWVLYRVNPNPQHQVDLVYALPLLDEAKRSVGSRLRFSLRHALSNVGEELTVKCDESLKEEVRNGVGTLYDEAQLILTSVSLCGTLTEKARLVLWNRGQANWEPVLSESPMLTTDWLEVFSGEHTLFTATSGESSTWRGTGKGIFFIPLEVNENAQSVTVRIAYTVRQTVDGNVTDAHRSSEVTLPLKDYAQEGKTLKLNITLQNL